MNIKQFNKLKEKAKKNNTSFSDAYKVKDEKHAYKVTYIKNDMYPSVIVSATNENAAKRIAEKHGIKNIYEVIQIDYVKATEIGFDFKDCSFSNTEVKDDYANELLAFSKELDKNDIAYTTNQEIAKAYQKNTNPHMTFKVTKEGDKYKVEVINRKNDSIKDVNPREGESKADFLARFMNETKSEYPDEKQRYAVANSYWEKKGKDSIHDATIKHEGNLELILDNRGEYTLLYKNKPLAVFDKDQRSDAITEFYNCTNKAFLMNEYGIKDSIKDGNLANSKLRVGQIVHLDQSKISKKLDADVLNEDYVIEGFYINQKLVKEDIAPEEYRDFNGVKIRGKKSGVAMDVNRFQLQDSVKDGGSVEVIGVDSKIGNTYILKVKLKSGTPAYLITNNYNGEKIHTAGGTVEFNREKAKQLAKDFETIDKLNKKYGEAEGYKRWMAGKKDSIKDSFYVVACEEGDYWFDNNGKPNSFSNAKRYNSYEEADRFRRSRGQGSVQKVSDSIKDSKYQFPPLTNEDIKYLSKYNLRLVSKLANGDCVVEGSKRDLARYGREYLDYQLHPDYLFDSVKDEDIEELSKEEQQAIDDYKKAIAGTKDVKLLELYSHILREEIEHLRELNEARTEDSIKDSVDTDVRQWWQQVETWNRQSGNKWNINNSGASTEDMLAAMFDMISDLKNVNDRLYKEGKRIYNKYSIYSQYRDSIKDSTYSYPNHYLPTDNNETWEYKDKDGTKATVKCVKREVYNGYPRVKSIINMYIVNGGWNNYHNVKLDEYHAAEYLDVMNYKFSRKL